MNAIRHGFFMAIVSVAVLPLAAQPGEVNHRFVQVNPIKMHIAEQSQGPLVVLLYGFPELWYSWRHVLPALAAAGYHAVAPDMRGYGQTDAPREIADYSQLQAAGDIVGLVQALGYEQAVIAGHDFGSVTAFNSANLRSDMFRAVVLLSVPYSVRAEGAMKPSEVNRRRVPQGMQFYQTYYQEPGVAEKVLDADPKRTLRMGFYFVFGLGSAGGQDALYVWSERNDTGCPQRAETTAVLAEAGGSGLLRKGILAHGLSWGPKLVSRSGHLLGGNSVPGGPQVAATSVVSHWWRRRPLDSPGQAAGGG